METEELKNKQALNAWKMLYRLMDNVKTMMDVEVEKGQIDNSKVHSAMEYVRNGIREIIKNNLTNNDSLT